MCLQYRTFEELWKSQEKSSARTTTNISKLNGNVSLYMINIDNHISLLGLMVEDYMLLRIVEGHATSCVMK
jgi:hypothetical protein